VRETKRKRVFGIQANRGTACQRVILQGLRAANDGVTAVDRHGRDADK
jgi:hypothetical protein